jgi:hypothetical protein
MRVDARAHRLLRAPPLRARRRVLARGVLLRRVLHALALARNLVREPLRALRRRLRPQRGRRRVRVGRGPRSRCGVEAPAAADDFGRVDVWDG